MSEAIVSRAQRNLGAYRYTVDRKGRKKRRRADSSGNLRKSLNFMIKKVGDEYRVVFLAKGTAGEYANFVEQGVNGTQKKWSSPFSFKGKNINQRAVLKWMKQKPVRLREYKDGKLGGFTKATEAKRKQAAFLIGRSIAKYGFAPLNFMSDAVTDELPKWTERLADAYAQDIADKLQ